MIVYELILSLAEPEDPHLDTWCKEHGVDYFLTGNSGCSAGDDYIMRSVRRETLELFCDELYNSNDPETQSMYKSMITEKSFEEGGDIEPISTEKQELRNRGTCCTST